MLGLQKNWKGYKISICSTSRLINFSLSCGLFPSVYRHFVVPPILKQNENILSLHTHLQLLFHFIPPLHSKSTQLFISTINDLFYFTLLISTIHFAPMISLMWVCQTHKILYVDQSSGCFSVFISFHLSSVFSSIYLSRLLGKLFPWLLWYHTFLFTWMFFLQSLFPATPSLLALWMLASL